MSPPTHRTRPDDLLAIIVTVTKTGMTGRESVPSAPAMTGQRTMPRCAWCGRAVPAIEPPGPGRPRKFCRRSCRQRNFEARVKATRHGLDEHDVVMARTELEELKDLLFVAVCAADDATADLDAADSAPEYRAIAVALLQAVSPLRTIFR
jgi:hypothetical protein